MFLSVIPPVDDDGSRSVVNIYMSAFTYVQVGCIRIRSLNTPLFPHPPSDEMIERNKATFPRMEGYVLFILIFLSKW